MAVGSLRGAVATFVLFLGMVPVALAQPGTGPQPPNVGRASVQAAPPRYPVSLEQALYLIRSTLLTLNDANRSGNYTVLRDLAAPTFQAENTDADLADDFKDLRRRRIDLYAVALDTPHLIAAPALDQDGMLQLSGFFPTRPLRITFDLKFQDVSGQWRLFGISVATPQAPPAKSPATRGHTTHSIGKQGQVLKYK